MKKIISVLLATVMLFAVMAPCAAAVSSRGSIPVIYIRGNGETIYKNDTEVVPAKFEDVQFGGEDGIDKDKLIRKCAEILYELAKSTITDDYEKYGKMLYDLVQPLFEGAQLDGNGNSLPGVSMHSSSINNNKTTCNVTRSSYGLWDYQFHYDWRLSPYDHVDDLHKYIENVRTANGGKKVAIYVRCFGGSLATAYLERYGHLGNVESVMFDATLNNGATVINDMFSGQVEFKASRLQQYLAQLEQCDRYNVGFGLTLEGLANEIVFKTFDLFTQNEVADGALDMVEDLYTKLYKALMPALCFAAGLATQANYWTAVKEEDFDAAMKLMFGSKEAQEAYPGLIEKIKYYREHVTSKGYSLYEKFMYEYGVRLGAVAKYGYMNMPLSDGVNEPSDALVSLADGSFGATVADIGKTLSADHLASADAKYISPDKMVDTSTGLFPETTWIIKNAHHNFFETDDVIARAFFFDKATVNTFSEVPQFIRYYEDELRYEPMTEENCEDYEWYSVAEEKPTIQTILVSMMRWFKMIFEIITQILKGEFELGNIIKK